MFAHIGPEALLVSLALLLALVRPHLGVSWFAKVERRLAAVVRRRTLSREVIVAADQTRCPGEHPCR